MTNAIKEMTLLKINPRTLGAIALCAATLGITAAGIAQIQPSSSPEGARVYFLSPQDGDIVGTTFTVKFGLTGMGVAPAGIDQENTGHHHLLVDTTIDDVDMSVPLPTSDTVKHFGGGQTETEVTLPPGEHTLQLVLGNYLHIPHDPPVVSDVITVTVVEGS